MSLFVPIHKFLPTKTASHGLPLQKLCSLGPINCFVSQEKAQGRTKNPVVMNLNISANDINTFKDSNTMGTFCQIFKCQIFGPIGKHYFQK